MTEHKYEVVVNKRYHDWQGTSEVFTVMKIFPPCPCCGSKVKNPDEAIVSFDSRAGPNAKQRAKEYCDYLNQKENL